MEIARGHVRHESRSHFLPSPFCREQIRARGFGRTTIFAPEVHFPCSGYICLPVASFKGRKEFRLSSSDIRDSSPAAHRWKLIGTSDAELCLCFKNTRRGDSQIVILL